MLGQFPTPGTYPCIPSDLAQALVAASARTSGCGSMVRVCIALFSLGFTPFVGEEGEVEKICRICRS